MANQSASEALCQHCRGRRTRKCAEIHTAAQSSVLRVEAQRQRHGRRRTKPCAGGAPLRVKPRAGKGHVLRSPKPASRKTPHKALSWWMEKVMRCEAQCRRRKRRRPKPSLGGALMLVEKSNGTFLSWGSLEQSVLAGTGAPKTRSRAC